MYLTGEFFDSKASISTRKHSSRMHTESAVTRPNNERVAMRPIVVRQTPVKSLPSPWGR